MAAERAQAKKDRATAMVRPYLLRGKIAEADKDQYIALAEANPDLAVITLKALSNNVLLDELGSETTDDPPTGGAKTDLSEDDQKEIERLAKLAKPVPAGTAS
jgi:hypothetical protein